MKAEVLKIEQKKVFEGNDLETTLEKVKENFKVQSNEEISYKIIQEPSKGFLGIGKKPIIIEACLNEQYLINRVYEFLGTILSYFEEEVDIKIKCHNKTITIYLEGDSLGKIIGKQGRNLGALQHLVMIYVNRMTDTKFDVRLDVGEYRKKRKKNLELIAEQAAKRAIITNTKVELSPMFAFERKAIHEYIKNNYPKLASVSVGLEPYRKVVIYPSRNGKRRY